MPKKKGSRTGTTTSSGSALVKTTKEKAGQTPATEQAALGNQPAEAMQSALVGRAKEGLGQLAVGEQARQTEDSEGLPAPAPTAPAVPAATEPTNSPLGQDSPIAPDTPAPSDTAQAVAGNTDAESGKAALPDLEYEGPNQDDEDDGPEPEPTEKNFRDLRELEAQAQADEEESFRARRTIRRRGLWKLHKDAEGRRLYPKYDQYCKNELGHSRQWVTHGTNWLTIQEMMRAAGIKNPPVLTVDAAQGLLLGRLKGAGGLLAVLQEAKEDGVPLTKDNLREIVLRRADYNYWSKTDGPQKAAAQTYAAHKKDCLAVKKLTKDNCSYSIVEKAQKAEGEFGENLVKVCTEERKLPVADQLLKALTGKALEDVVDRLAVLGQGFADLEAKKNLLAARKKQIKEMLQEGGLVKIREEAKGLQAELEKAGVIKPKQKRKLKKDEEAGAGEGEEAEPSEVRENLDAAIQSLDAALDCDWPEDGNELRAILKSAVDAEKKLGQIVGKTKERMADAPVEPEAIRSGHN